MGSLGVEDRLTRLSLIVRNRHKISHREWKALANSGTINSARRDEIRYRYQSQSGVGIASNRVLISQGDSKWTAANHAIQNLPLAMPRLVMNGSEHRYPYASTEC